MNRLVGSLIVGSLAIWPVTAAQVSQLADVDPRLAGFDAHQVLARTSPFRNLGWSFLGPTNAASMTFGIAVADRGANRRIYVIYRSGGLWKSDDNGTSWQHVTTGAAEPALNAVAVAPSNPDIVWLGTGAGLYKSVDAARTWKYVGMPDFADTHGCPSLGGPCGRLVVHPTNPDIVYAALMGPMLVDSATRGVFKTVDGGKSWTRVLFRNLRAGAADLVIDPSSPERLYAVLWEHIFEVGWAASTASGSSTFATAGGIPFITGQDPDAGETSIWTTTNGGDTWTEIAAGLPEKRLRGRIGIDLARSNPKVLYAVVNTYEPLAPGAPTNRVRGAQVYRTDDQGLSWRKTSETIVESASYMDGFGQIRVDPKDENTLYTLGVELNVSRDAGRRFQLVRGPHADHKSLWIDPKRDVLYDGTDGGLYVIEHAGTAFSHWPSPTAAFYNVALDNATPFHAYGSVQDYTSYRVAVAVGPGRGPLRAQAFETAPGFEFTYHAIDPTNPHIVFASPAHARPSRFDLSDPARRPVEITPVARAGEPPLRGIRLIPLVLSPHDPRTIYTGYQYVFRSRDRGDRWEQISGDLTDNDLEARRSSPFRVQMITTIAESPREPGLVYAGTDDGNLHVTRDGGQHWTKLAQNLARGVRVSGVVPSAFAAGTVYVVQGKVPWRHDRPDFGVSILKSVDYGARFTSLAANIPIGPASVLREDPTDPKILYLGTRLGVYVSTNGGARWEVLGGNFPPVFVSDLQIHPRDHIVVAATFGRGMWAMDATAVRAVR